MRISMPWGPALVAAMVAGLVGACSDDDPVATTGAGGATSSASVTKAVVTQTVGPGTTGQGGAGGMIDPMVLCQQAADKKVMCGADGSGGGGGAEPLECTETEVCEAKCILEAPCNEVKLEAGDFADCLYCCVNPHLC